MANKWKSCTTRVFRSCCMCNRFDSFRGLRLVLCGLVSVVTCFHSLGFPRLRAADPRHLENFLGFFLALLLLLRAQIEFSMAHNSEFISAIISSPPCLDYLWFFLRTTPRIIYDSFGRVFPAFIWFFTRWPFACGVPRVKWAFARPPLFSISIAKFRVCKHLNGKFFQIAMANRPLALGQNNEQQTHIPRNLHRNNIRKYI